jgi:DNA invertase Pin-like site-specific DNA recombinase
MIFGYLVVWPGDKNSAKIAGNLRRHGAVEIVRDRIMPPARLPRLAELLKRIGRRDELMVQSVSRVAPTFPALSELLQSLALRGASLTSIDEPWATLSASGARRVVAVLNGMATLERHQGPRGNRNTDEHALIKKGRRPSLDAAAVRAIVAQKQAGKTIKTICHELNLSPATIYRSIQLHADSAHT